MTASSRRSFYFAASTILVFLSLLVAGCRHHRRSTSAPNTADYADNIKSAVSKPQLAVLRWPNYSDYQPAVKTFYDDRDYELAWLRDLKPTPQTLAFIQAFQDAGSKGLNADDYDASRWPQRLADVASIQSANNTSDGAADTIAQFDAAMTICVMRYISDLRIGRVNPQHFNFDIDVSNKKYDLAEFLSDNAVDATDVPALVRSVEPDSDQYRATEAALVHYLNLAHMQVAAAAPPLPDVPKGGVGVGGEYAATGQLLARLQLEGNAPGDYPYQPPPSGTQASVSEPPSEAHIKEKTIARADRFFHRRGVGVDLKPPSTQSASAEPAFNPQHLPPVYTRELSTAVKDYQHRHGLNEDGRLTPQTIASLNVPLTERVIQLQDSLERWRWLPAQYINAPLMVNLPEFILRGYGNSEPADPNADSSSQTASSAPDYSKAPGSPQHHLEFTMRVVVGKVVGDHDTPVFVRMMRYLIFRPYWSVPHDIVEKELMPHIRASGIGYLASHNFEVVDGKGNVISSPTAKQVEHGGVQVREKPGPKNSLGLVKFMFPNQYDIYLHSTPETQLFSQSRRDFSHGCIRVQKPEDLAVWVLTNSNTSPPRGQDEWDLDTVHDIMNNGQDNHQVSFKTPIPIVIFYATAIVAEDGQAHFFDDIYGYDQSLQEVLSKGPPYPTQPYPSAPKTTPGDTAAAPSIRTQPAGA